MRHGSIPSLGKVNANFNLGNKLDVGSASPKWKLSPRYYFCSISKYTIFPIKKLHWTAQQQRSVGGQRSKFSILKMPPKISGSSSALIEIDRGTNHHDVVSMSGHHWLRERDVMAVEVLAVGLQNPLIAWNSR